MLRNVKEGVYDLSDTALKCGVTQKRKRSNQKAGGMRRFCCESPAMAVIVGFGLCVFLFSLSSLKSIAL